MRIVQSNIELLLRGELGNQLEDGTITVVPFGGYLISERPDSGEEPSETNAYWELVEFTIPPQSETLLDLRDFGAWDLGTGAGQDGVGLPIRFDSIKAIAIQHVVIPPSLDVDCPIETPPGELRVQQPFPQRAFLPLPQSLQPMQPGETLFIHSADGWPVTDQSRMIQLSSGLTPVRVSVRLLGADIVAEAIPAIIPCDQCAGVDTFSEPGFLEDDQLWYDVYPVVDANSIDPEPPFQWEKKGGVLYSGMDGTQHGRISRCLERVDEIGPDDVWFPDEYFGEIIFSQSDPVQSQSISIAVETGFADIITVQFTSNVDTGRGELELDIIDGNGAVLRKLMQDILPVSPAELSIRLTLQGLQSFPDLEEQAGIYGIAIRYGPHILDLDVTALMRFGQRTSTTVSVNGAADDGYGIRQLVFHQFSHSIDPCEETSDLSSASSTTSTALPP